MKVTIITPVYNGEEYLEKTVLSIISQSYKNIEYIVVDGGSTDSTMQIIQKYSSNIDIVISEPDKGMYDAIAKGIDASTGELITWINCDDILYPWAVKYAVLEANKGFQWITGVPSKINSNEEMIEVLHPERFFRFAIRLGWYKPGHLGPIQQEGTFFTRSLYNRTFINSNLKLAGDYDLWIKFASLEKVKVVKTILASFRVHRKQLSSNLVDYLSECNQVKRVWYFKIFRLIKGLGILLIRSE